MKIFLLFAVLLGLAIGISFDANAKKDKKTKILSVYLEKKRTDRGLRNILPPIVGSIDPFGNSIDLNSPEDADIAYVTISGDNGEYLTDMVNFSNRNATLDLSELGFGVYTITVEFENDTVYIGQFEFE